MTTGPDQAHPQPAGPWGSHAPAGSAYPAAAAGGGGAGYGANAAGGPPPPVCPRHPDRVSYLQCQRCGRPACPECQRPAAVGFHCVDCVAAEQQAATAAATARVDRGGLQDRLRAGFGAPTSVHSGGVGNQRPVVTYAIIAACVLLYLGQMASPSLSDDLAYAPLQGRSEPWRLLTSAFLHGGVTHILFNMFALASFGPALEGLLGRGKFLAVYLLSALGGSVGYLFAAALTTGDYRQMIGGLWVTSMVGASGAVFGVWGTLLLFMKRLHQPINGMIVVLIINLLLPLIYPQIAWQAHVGGFVIGLLAGAALYWAAGRGARWRQLQWGALAALGVALVAVAGAIYASVDDAVLRIMLGY